MKSLETWRNNTEGQRVDFDNASYDCVDVSKSWIIYLSNKPWTESAGWGNAKDIYYNWSDKYLSRVPRGNAAKLGDIVVMNGLVGGGYGHTGVVVGIDGNNIIILQQNTFTQQAAYLGTFDMYASYITGYLRPTVAFSEGNVPLAEWQRKVGADYLMYRTGPATSYALMKTDTMPEGKFAPGDIVDLKGVVKGQDVNGNIWWGVGRYSGGNMTMEGFTDTSTTGLPDLTPQPLGDKERKVSNDAMNVRRSAVVAPDNVAYLKQPGEKITIVGFIHGMAVDGNDIWYKLNDGNFTWSGGYTDTTVTDLPDLTPKEPTPPAAPTYPAPTNDASVTRVFNKKNPVGQNYEPTDLVSIGGQRLRKEAADSLTLMQKVTALLSPASGYRSYATQKSLYDNYVKQDGQAEADRYSARPGYSEHQTGLTMDFAPIDDSFKNFAAYKFLAENGYKYGWVLRYPADKEAVTGYMSEPWHWRYVGVDVATDMYNKGITTLEEYYGIEGGGYADSVTPTDPVDETPTKPDPEKPIPSTLDAYITSIIRTAVPYLVGLVSSIAVTHKLILPAGTLELLTALLTFLFGTGWYIVWRWLETKFPQLGWFLGKASQPIYPKEEK